MREDSPCVLDSRVPNRSRPGPAVAAPAAGASARLWGASEREGGAESESAGRRPPGSDGGCARGARGAGPPALPAETSCPAAALPAEPLRG